MSSGTRVRPSSHPGYTSTRDTKVHTIPEGLTWMPCPVCGKTSLEEYCPKHREPK